MCGVYICLFSYIRVDVVCWVGLKVVNVFVFEKYVGSLVWYLSDYIFLENGKCLKEILEIGLNVNKDKVNIMDVLRFVIGEVGGEIVKIRV